MKKEIRILILFFVVSLTTSFTVMSQKDHHTLITEFFSIYKTSPSKAIDHVFAKDDLFAIQKSSKTNLKSELNSSLATLGKYNSHTMMVDELEDTQGEIIYCTVTHEKGSILLIFSMKPIDGVWKVTRLDIDKNSEKLPPHPKELVRTPVTKQ